MAEEGKQEEIITNPAAGRPVHTPAGPGENPADPLTGGGKLKSADRRSETILKSEQIGESPSKQSVAASYPREGSVDESGDGEAGANKEGMEKSAKRDQQDIGTATQSPGSRIHPNSPKE